ncbi:hypothetical protein EDB89DRAFT_2180193 [Lactarius sanguifluus]|nr:hypothetical protein EDB89DRAFT_2180193 [Lactarius sanguifluus]
MSQLGYTFPSPKLSTVFSNGFEPRVFPGLEPTRRGNGRISAMRYLVISLASRAKTSCYSKKRRSGRPVLRPDTHAPLERCVFRAVDQEGPLSTRSPATNGKSGDIVEMRPAQACAYREACREVRDNLALCLVLRHRSSAQAASSPRHVLGLRPECHCTDSVTSSMRGAEKLSVSRRRSGFRYQGREGSASGGRVRACSDLPLLFGRGSAGLYYEAPNSLGIRTSVIVGPAQLHDARRNVIVGVCFESHAASLAGSPNYWTDGAVVRTVLPVKSDDAERWAWDKDAVFWCNSLWLRSPSSGAEPF